MNKTEKSFFFVEDIIKSKSYSYNYLKCANYSPKYIKTIILKYKLLNQY